MLGKRLVLVGAYGRQYPTVEAARDAWNIGVDFKIYSGPYRSIRDLDKLQAGFCEVFIYLPNLRESFVVSTH